jgi:hypothetical protein
VKSLATLVLSLVQEIVLTVLAMVSGDMKVREGLRPLLASVVALAVAVLVIRAIAWGLQGALTGVLSRLLGAA